MNVEQWVPDAAVEYCRNVAQWKIDLTDKTKAERIESCEECDEELKPEFVRYYHKSLLKIIESPDLRLFWQWMQEAADRHDSAMCQITFMVDEILNAGYRADQSQTNEGTSRIAAGAKLAKLKSLREGAIEFLTSLDTLEDAKMREDTNAYIESLNAKENALPEYERKAKRAGCPWVRFGVEIYQGSCDYFSDYTPSACRIAELATVLSGRNINRQSIEKRVRNLTA